MRTHYDFSHAQKNPYAAKLRKSVTIRMRTDVIDYFKTMTREMGVPYQNLINLYLSDCMQQHRKLAMTWPSSVQEAQEEYRP